MSRIIFIAMIMGLASSGLSQPFHETFSENYVSELIEVPGNGSGGQFEAKLMNPIIEMPKGNCHIVSMRYAPRHLEVTLAWDSSEVGNYQLTNIPWADIFSGQVKYSLAAHYDESGSAKRYDNNPPGKREGKPLSERTLMDRDGSTVSIRFEHNNFVVCSDHESNMKIPSVYRVITFDVASNYILILVESDQGYRDGELLRPLLTSQIFILALDGLM